MSGDEGQVNHDDWAWLEELLKQVADMLLEKGINPEPVVQLLRMIIAGSNSPETAQTDPSSPVKVQVERPISANDRLFAVGDQAQTGDIHIRDMAGNNIIKLTLVINQPPQPTTQKFHVPAFAPPDPAYVPTARAKELFNRIQTKPGYTPVTAEPGVGKTELVRWIYRKLKHQLGDDFPIIAYSFDTDNPETIEQIYQNLLTQARQFVTNPDALDTDNWLTTVANQSLQPAFVTVKVVVLLDGLDESLPEERKQLNNYLLPKQLPEGVAVLLTMRPSYFQDLRLTLQSNHPLFTVEKIPLEPMSEAEIHTLLTEYYQVVDTKKTVHYIYTATKGFPIEVRYLCAIAQEAWRKAQPILPALQHSSKSINSLQATFEQSINRFTQIGKTEKEQSYLRDLVYLVALQDRLTIDSAEKVLKCNSDFIEQVLRRESTIVLRLNREELTLYQYKRFREYLSQQRRYSQVDNLLGEWARSVLKTDKKDANTVRDAVRYAFPKISEVGTWENYSNRSDWNKHLKQMYRTHAQRLRLEEMRWRLRHVWLYQTQSLNGDTIALLIGVGLLLAQPPHRLPPELLVELSQCAFWNDTDDYMSQHYWLKDEQDYVRELLSANTKPSMSSDLIEASEELADCIKHADDDRQKVLKNWIIRWERPSGLVQATTDDPENNYTLIREKLNDPTISDQFIKDQSTTSSSELDQLITYWTRERSSATANRSVDAIKQIDDKFVVQIADHLLAIPFEQGRKWFIQVLDELLPWRDGLTPDDALTGLSILAPVIVRYAPESLGLIDRVIALVADLVSEE
jgi:hypothetical protein